METVKIFAEIDAEIRRLQQAKVILSGATIKRSPGRPKSTTATAAKKKRKMSAEGRARLVAAVKARWAKTNAH
jgi:hypothetical protein